MNKKYADHPGHPLYHMPEEVLEVARKVLRNAVVWGDVDPEIDEAIADAVILNLHEAGYIKMRRGTRG